MLGSAFAKAASRRQHEVIGLVGNYAGNVDGLARQESLDLSDLPRLEQFVLELFPDAIVNCAAFSIAAECESQPEASERINVALPEKLALLSRHLFARFVHISSDQVFDGKGAPYGIGDAPNPNSQYAVQKLESEKKVAAINPEFASIVRIPLLNGNSLSGKRSLHEQLFRSWSQGLATPLFEDEIRQPCLTGNLADALVELCERNDLQGLLHWAGETRLSRYEMGIQILDHFKLPHDLVKRTTRDSDPRFAHRQADLSLDLQPMEGKLKTRPQAFQDQLDALNVPPPCRDWYNAL